MKNSALTERMLRDYEPHLKSTDGLRRQVAKHGQIVKIDTSYYLDGGIRSRTYIFEDGWSTKLGAVQAGVASL